MARRLEEAGAADRAELVLTETRADRRLELPIAAFGGEGAFVAEVEQAVLDGRAEVAVHSAKDLPAAPAGGAGGLVLAAVPERAAVQDALVGRSLDELSPGALVATGAPRRRAQLAWLRPDLGFVELRGSIGTRLERVPPGGAAVVALAALERLGLTEAVAEVLATTVLLPQVGQGAIALRCREEDETTRAALALIDDPEARRCLEAERAFLARLGGGCEAPVGALARLVDGGGLVVEGLLAGLDGHALVRRRVEGVHPVETGRRLADELLGEGGGRALVAQASP